MGSLQATEIANSGLSLEDSLAYHLKVGHYPPIPIEMIEVCKEAIVLMNEGLPNSQIDLPLGTSYRGDTTAPAWAIADAHHLDAWIDEEEN
tara:strand:- start:449 stop:721 length:273 start_codon:yes stop_codon:yes gene_type:complete